MEYFWFFIVILFIIISAALFNDSKIKSLETQVKRMRFTLDQIADQVDMPEHPVNNELRKLLKAGKKVKAVKEARQVLGLSLVKAK